MVVVLKSLSSSIGPLANVSLVILVVWVVFAIVAISLLRDQLGVCKTENSYNTSKKECLELGLVWTRQPWNHDNVVESLVTLFVLSNMEAWPDLVFASVDAGSDETGPIYNSKPWILVYYYIFIFVSSMFLMDLFVAVIFYQFNLQTDEANLSGTCTDDQIRWITI